MKEQFEKYLIKMGYSLVTPSGKQSTVYDYKKRIDKICEWEGLSWEGLAENISGMVSKYDVGGSKEEWGHKSHNAVINALRRYQDFLNG